METNYSRALQADAKAPKPGLLLRKVHDIYRKQFRRWFGIMAPTSLLAGVVLVLTDARLKAMYRGISRGRYDAGQTIEAFALRIGGFFLAWLLGCFALAAIATVVSGLEPDDTSEEWIHDSYERPREYFGAISCVAVVTFFALGLALIGIGFVESLLVHLVGWSQFARFSFAWGVLMYVIAASLVSWLGVAIPLMVHGGTGVWAALKKSVHLSNGYEGALFVLVVESLAGSMILWYAIVHGLPALLPRHLLYTVWYGYLLNAAGVLAGAAIDAPLFIGLSLLADPQRFTGRLLLNAEEATRV